MKEPLKVDPGRRIDRKEYRGEGEDGSDSVI